MSGVIVRCVKCKGEIMSPIPNRKGERIHIDPFFKCIYENFECCKCGKIVHITVNFSYCKTEYRGKDSVNVENPH